MRCSGVSAPVVPRAVIVNWPVNESLPPGPSVEHDAAYAEADSAKVASNEDQMERILCFWDASAVRTRYPYMPAVFWLDTCQCSLAALY